MLSANTLYDPFGVEVSQSVYLSEGLGIDLTINGARYLQAGYVETDYENLDPNAHRGATGIITQSSKVSGFGATTIRSVTFGNGLFVAVGDSGKISTSPDGDTWTLRSSGVTSHLRGVTFGNGIFVAVGLSSAILTSVNGIDWDIQTPISGFTVIFSAVYGNGVFVIAGGNNGSVSVSTDGMIWSDAFTAFSNDVIFDLSYGNGVFIASGQDGSLATSINGTDWVQRSTIFGSADINTSVFGNGQFVVGGNSNNL